MTSSLPKGGSNGGLIRVLAVRKTRWLNPGDKSGVAVPCSTGTRYIGAVSFANSSLALTTSLSNPLAVALADSASFPDCSAFELRRAISRSEMLWRWVESAKIAASDINSPPQPKRTNNSNSFSRWCHQGSLYSPQIPITSNTPETNRKISDNSNPTTVSGFDNKRKYPISPYLLLGGLVFAVQGFLICCLGVGLFIERGRSPFS